MLRPAALDHVGLKVTDLDRTLHFYQRLGLTLLRTPGPHADGLRSAVISGVVVPAPARQWQSWTPAIARRLNEAFALKYAAADWIVALSGDASQRVVVRLDKPQR
jgi:catechol 2,3-dioxygenase-like lactoylglutathione lyase family enzyme